MSGQCGKRGPGGAECTRYGTDHDRHAAYVRIDGELNRVGWFACNPIGEPTE